MAIITMKLGETSQIAQAFMENWDKEKDNVKLSARAMYSMLGIRNKCIDNFRTIQETAIQVAKAHGGVDQPGGGVKVPDEEIDAVNEELNELQSQDYELEYTPIRLNDNDVMPLAFMDILYTFIEME